MGRLDRFGDELEPDDADTTPKPLHACTDGWIDVDTARPCPTCRPWHAPCPTCGTPPRACRADPITRCCDQCPHQVPITSKTTKPNRQEDHS